MGCVLQGQGARLDQSNSMERMGLRSLVLVGSRLA